ncbi:amp dependent CoA ligase [Laetiporus sulphureus 93-53]|uniref:Amp dependent CoA ligase n=1 Tax=Laetiporus sulphureus 93-53 TaxID=1314785 RepID=A0A165C156_9APHY|nr:amp dependent CoA ligase [Laetiporus sulphureus 93-53]KZT02013.1 amp dependent CoA ligase [Laetiporus sulphureus 93-53]
MAEIQGSGGPLPAIPDDMTIVQFMLDYRHPSRPAARNAWFIDDVTGRRIGEDEIRFRTDALANGLSSRWPIEENDVVCIFSPNHIDYPVVFWALQRIGATVTFVAAQRFVIELNFAIHSTANPAYTADELMHQLKTTKAKYLLVHSFVYSVALSAARAVGIPTDFIVLVDSRGISEHSTIQSLIEVGWHGPRRYKEPRLRPGEAKTRIAMLCFSSGTTGLPKAVAIPHYAVIANVIQVATYANADPNPWERKMHRPGDVVLAVLPFYHGYGLIFILHSVLFYSMTLVVVPKFDFVSMLKSIERYRINYLPIVPPIVVLLCKHPEVSKHDLSSIRVILSSAAPVSREVTQQLMHIFPDASIAQGYGLTETTVTLSMPRLDMKIATPGSSGVLLPGVTARILRADGSLASRNEPGQLVATGPAMALCYSNNEQATKETFVDGWVYTGDEVMFDDNGELFVIDRIKELLKVKGFQVAPAELEGFLLNHSDVSDVCIAGIPDDFQGDLLLAFVVLNGAAQRRIREDPAHADAIRAALIQYVARGKAAYKQLTAGVEFVEAIPRNPSGKLLRRTLRDRARELWRTGMLTSSTKARL